MRHVHSNLGEQVRGRHLFDPRDGGTQPNGFLIVTNLVLNLGVELGPNPTLTLVANSKMGEMTHIPPKYVVAYLSRSSQAT